MVMMVKYPLGQRVLLDIGVINPVGGLFLDMVSAILLAFILVLVQPFNSPLTISLRRTQIRWN